MSNPVTIFGSLPEGRKLPGAPDRPEATFGVLRAATPELCDVLRRHIREIDADDLKRLPGGIQWNDMATGDELEIITSFVDPIAPAEAGCVAFTIRDGYVVTFRSRGDQGQVESQYIGTIGGGRATGRERLA